MSTTNANFLRILFINKYLYGAGVLIGGKVITLHGILS